MMHFQSKAEMDASLLDLRISPNAVMKLFLRFDTPEGPRTVVAPNVPLLLATQIVAAMSRVGLHAEYVEQCDRLSIAEHLELNKLENISGAHDPGNVITVAMSA
jgi:hypothetical protein